MVFSIVIPTYNRSNFIPIAIKSVLNQTYSNFELIIVDDGSTDNTKEVVLSITDPRIQYHKKENRERGAARNYGCNKAKGDYIVFFDSDDIMYQNCLSTAYEFIKKNNPIIFHLAYEIRDSNNKLLQTINHLKDINHLLIKGNPLSCINVFIRSDAAKKELFVEDRTMAGFEDWELWLRMAVRHTIFNVDEISACMINHNDRSVLQTDKDKLIQRTEKFMAVVLFNKNITQYYNNKLHIFKASCYTYISLHIALTKKNKTIAIKYLIKGLIQNPFFLFERRFLAIIKHLLF